MLRAPPDKPGACAETWITRDGVVTRQLGHGQNSLRTDALGASTHVQGDYLGVYASGTLGPIALRGGAATGWQDLRGYRTVAFGHFADTLRSTGNARTTQAWVEGSHAFSVGAHQQLEPYVNLAQAQVRIDGMHEGGGAAALVVGRNSTDVNVATVGLRDTWVLDDAGATRAHASIGYQKAWGDLTPVTRMRFAAGGDSFAIAGVPVAQHATTVDLGVDVKLSKNVKLDASYLGQFGSGVTVQGARMSLNVAF